jgi:hypothetical protein
LSTALVPITPIRRDTAAAPATSRPQADFIAQLIATSEQAAQTRARRRAAPAEATEIYRARGQAAAITGKAFSRSF